jgi:alpha-amylase
MKTSSTILLLIALFFSNACNAPQRTTGRQSGNAPFLWENANIYFLLTDRFFNGDPNNDVNFGRSRETATLRGFQGGDIKGIIRKLEEGYFEKLGVSAIWLTPVVEQIHEATDEGTGLTYGFHGYWAKDWTALDPNFGSAADFQLLVETAHRQGIRILLDVVINHTGPVTAKDPVWPAAWVRTEPQCIYKDYSSTVSCTLVKNLPDIKTESNAAVDLPDFLKEKWRKEGRLEQEMAELDAFFARTGYPRASRYYIIKWLTDFIRQFGVDGFRLDTTKHTEEEVWAELRREADHAFQDWKKANPSKVLDDNHFYMVGEVYGYNISSGRLYDFGDRKVDYFNHGLTSLINFEFKYDAARPYEEIFSKYDRQLNGPLKGHSVLNYISSHDDGSPFDKERMRALEAGTKLLLCPGASQIYYGDESSRSLQIQDAQGDATLRSFMNWDELESKQQRNGVSVNEVLAHWQKLGQFRRAHPAVGAGRHEQVASRPYLFKRSYSKGNFQDAVLVGLELPKGRKEIPVSSIFANGEQVVDYYSGKKLKVAAGRVVVDSEYDIVLLGKQ